MLIFFLHMYIHLHIATVNCVLSDMYTVWLFFYHIFSEYIMPVYLCVLICVYIYVCIYTCHLHTPLTCILSCILAHNFLRILKHLSTLTHSFQCWLFTVCVSCYPLICICLCLCLCLYAMTASVPVLSIFFTVYIFFLKRSMLSETPQFAGSSPCSQEAFDATDNAIFLSTLDKPSFFWKCYDIFVVLLRIAVLMCTYLLSCVCFLYCVYMHVSFTPVPVPLHFSFI